MSIGSFGGINSAAAGAPLSARGSDNEKNQKAVSAQATSVDHERHAEEAAGIGQTESDKETSDRDADGRRLWEAEEEETEAENVEGLSDLQNAEQPKSKDITGDSGNSLDLTG